MSKIILDFETEMVGDYGDPYPRIIQIGLIKISDDWSQLLDQWEQLVHPERPLFPRGHLGEFPHDLTKAPTFADVSDTLSSKLAGNEIWAWPAQFESPVIKMNYHRVGGKYDPYINCLRSFVNGLVGTHSPTLSSGNMARKLGLTIQSNHQALADCYRLWVMTNLALNQGKKTYTIECRVPSN
mgnify:CR=1 FL=1